MSAEEFLEDVMECERQLALVEGENALLRRLVLKLFQRAPSLNDSDRRLVTRIMRETPEGRPGGKL